VSTDGDLRFGAVRIAALNAIERESPDAALLVDQLDALNPGRPDQELAAAVSRGILALESGRIHEAEKLFEAKAPLLSHARDPLIRTAFVSGYSNVAATVARYDLALDLAGIQAEDAEAAGLDFALDYALVHRARAQIGLRRILSAQRTLEELGRREELHTQHVSANALMQHLRLRIARGDLAGASVMVQRQVATCLSDGARGELAAFRGLILAAQGELEGAAESLHQATAQTTLVDAALLSALGLAIVSLERGEAEETAVSTLQRVIGLGHRDAVVFACRAYPGLAQAGARDPDLVVPLTALFVASRDIDLGRRAGLKMPRELRPREELSPRERDVYELLAQGRSNRDIARTLFISESTTKVHVRHIFEKLGVRTRAEAAVATVRGPSGSDQPAKRGP
jgi:DNA-binding CsgD family transcriptional regulator